MYFTFKFLYTLFWSSFYYLNLSKFSSPPYPLNFMSFLCMKINKSKKKNWTITRRQKLQNCNTKYHSTTTTTTIKNKPRSQFCTGQRLLRTRLIYPVSLHRRKLIFLLQEAINYKQLFSDGALCPPSPLHSGIFFLAYICSGLVNALSLFLWDDLWSPVVCWRQCLLGAIYHLFPQIQR